MTKIKDAIKSIEKYINPQMDTVKSARTLLDNVAAQLSSSLGLDIRCVPYSMAVHQLLLYVSNKRQLLTCDIEGELIHVSGFGIERSVSIEELESLVCEILTQDICLKLLHSYVLDNLKKECANSV